MVVALPLAGLSLAANAADCPKGKIKIYTSWPMQGAMLPEGTGMKNAVDLAVDQNHAEAAGYCLEVVNLDDASPQTGKWDGAVEAENANKAVADPDAMVYIGTYNSGAAKISMTITQRAHMAQVTPANTYPGLTKKAGAAPGEPEIYRPLGIVSYFRVPPADDIQGSVGAKWAKKLGHHKVYILNDQELYGKGIADVFETEAKKIGLQVLGNEGIDYKQPDQKPILTKIRATGADLIYMGAVVETGGQTIIRQMKDLGMVTPKVSFIGPDGLYEEELLKATTCEAAMDVDLRVTFAGLPGDQLKGKGGQVYKLYKERFKIEPTTYALYSWEAAEVAIDGIKRAGVKDREKIRAAIAATKNFDGLNGKWSFDANGDTTMDVMSGYKVVKADTPIGCKFEFVDVLK
ncbi:MAG: branched-chain amino acid ABC transporter substrate-binding protein [Alphaproteobacteria bacterium]